MTTLPCWLLLDRIESSFPGVGTPGADDVIALRLVGYEPAAGATEWLRYEDVVADRVQAFDRVGRWRSDLPCATPEAVWTQLPYDRRPDARPVAAAPRRVPAFLVTMEPGGRAHVYSCSRIRQSGLLFSRIWAGAADPDGSPVVAQRTACAEQPELLRQFTDESHQMTRFEDDVEIELKLTLRRPASPWDIACDLAEAVQDRRLPGFLPDLGNELQRWTYEQDTFEVSGPGDRNGYVAFMADTDGSYAVKYKFFAEDALRRVETFDEGIRLEPGGFADYVRTALGEVRLRPLPHLVRTRFDVNVESARAGHFFGLEMDEVRAGGRVLQQLEIEYHRTRDCYRITGDTIDDELFRLADHAQRLLAERGVETDRGYLSKLSFLREVAAGAA